MATIERYINTLSTAGGDGTTNATFGATRAYASMSEWESAMGAGNAADDYIVDCCGGTADTTAVTLNFAANSIQIRGNRADPAGFYDGFGLVSPSHYRLRIVGASPLLCQAKSVTVDGIQIQIHTNGVGYTGIDMGACTGASAVRNCRVHADGVTPPLGIGTLGGSQGSPGGNTWTYENNVVVGFNVGVQHSGANFWPQTVTIQENTIRCGGTSTGGIVIADPSNADTDYFVYGNAISNTGAAQGIVRNSVGTSTFTADDNACSVASGTSGEIVLASEGAAYVSAGALATSDFRPLNTGPLYQVVNPTRVTTDIVGFTRDGASHDAGAFEYQAAGGGASHLAKIIQLMGA